MLKVLSLSMALALAASANAASLADYRPLSGSEADNRNCVANPAFDEGDSGKNWVLGNEAEISASHGRNQRGLGIVRTDPARYSVNTQKVKLKPGTKYVAGCWIKNENFAPSLKTGGSFGIEWYRAKENLSAAYLSSSGNHDWKLYTREFTTSPESDVEYVLAFFVGKGKTGAASFDDVFIREVGAEWLPALLVPTGATLRGGDGRIEIGSSTLGAFHYPGVERAGFSCHARLKKAGKMVAEQTARLKHDRASFDFGKLEPGQYELDLTLLDTVNRLRPAQRNGIRFQVLEPEKFDRRAVCIDRHGRMIVGGKPFLPIGLYAGGVNDEDLAFWKKSPFNFIMPYGGPKLKYEGEWTAGDDTGNLRRALDRLDSSGLKFVCNLIASYPKLNYILSDWDDGKVKGIDETVNAISDAVRNHPAMLAYYSCDELPAARSRDIETRRNQLNTRDPDHPTMAAYFQYPDLPYYSNGQDILGLIFYPVVGPKSRSMELIVSNMEAAQKTVAGSDGAMSVWAVAQAFNWGSYVKDRKRFATEYRFPSEQEMTAMSLLAAIYGAKGFIFYSYHELRYVKGCLNENEKMIEFCETWPQVCAMGSTLRGLAPYLLSLRQAPTVTVEKAKGKVKARAFIAEDGKSLRVLVTGIGPGEADATLSVPGCSTLKSQFGKTESLGDGRYRFRGNDICCDILSTEL